MKKLCVVLGFVALVVLGVMTFQAEASQKSGMDRGGLQPVRVEPISGQQITIDAQGNFQHVEVQGARVTAGIDPYACKEDFECLDEGEQSFLLYRMCGNHVAVIGIGGPFNVVDLNLPYSSFGHRTLSVGGCLGDEGGVVRFEFSRKVAGVTFSHTDDTIICCEVSGVEASFCGNLGYMSTGFGTGTDRIGACEVSGGNADNVAFFYEDTGP